MTSENLLPASTYCIIENAMLMHDQNAGQSMVLFHGLVEHPIESLNGLRITTLLFCRIDHEKRVWEADGDSVLYFAVSR